MTTTVNDLKLLSQELCKLSLNLGDVISFMSYFSKVLGSAIKIPIVVFEQQSAVVCLSIRFSSFEII